MATKLETFLKKNDIDRRRLLVASKQIEKLRSEDRGIRLKLRQARKREDAKKPEGLSKPRSGKPVNEVTLDAALSGERISGPARTRILRAVNRILEQKKKKPVSLDALFEVPKANPPKPKPAAEEGGEGESTGEKSE